MKLSEKIEKYHIRPQNTYNFDEKGFLIGVCHAAKRIVPIEHLQKKKTLGASQDGSREFISLVASICTDGATIPPALIYQGDSRDMQDTWLEDFDHSRDEAYFAVSSKGWTSEDLGVRWLRDIFDRHTKEKAGNSRRLLIADGHSSHVNLRFIDYCDRNRILLVILPPHSTHRLQPLDVGVFSPLAHAYSEEIDQLIQSSCGFSRMTKRNFWKLFHTAWTRALTLKNIKSGFAATGIHPLNPPKVLDSLQKKTPSPISSDDESRKRKTPSSVRGLRRLAKEIRKEQASLGAKTETLLRASEKFITENEILKHQNKGLRAALVEEKNRRKRGKVMGLFDKERPGEAQFFSPAKVAAVRERAKEIEAQAQQRKALAEAKRLDRTRRAIEKEERARIAREKKEQRSVARNEARNQLALEKEDRQARKLAEEQLEEEKSTQGVAEKQGMSRSTKSKRKNGEHEEAARKRRKAEDLRPSDELQAPQKAAQKRKMVLKSTSAAAATSSAACVASGTSSNRDQQFAQVGRGGRKITLPLRYRD